MQDRNEIIFRGSVVSMNVASKISTIRMVLETNGRKYFPQIYVYDNKILNGINIKDRIYVKGYTQNQLVYHRSTNKSGKQTVFVANEIYHAGRLLCDYFPSDIMDGDAFDGGASEDINKIILCGRVTSFYEQNNDYIRVKLTMFNDGYERQCDLTCTKRQGAYARKHLKEGDYVVAIGYAYTNIKTMPDKNKIYYESCFCQDICKVKNE